jgi:hypothetical protein
MGGKGFLIAIGIIVAAVAADQHYNAGYYTDGTLAMLGQIKQAFGF